MIALALILGGIIVMLLIALTFARQAAERASDIAAMDLARSMEAEIKRSVAEKKKQLDAAAETAINQINGKSDDELQDEINRL